MDLNEWADKVYKVAKEHGFHDLHDSQDSFVEAACNNLHDEISELHEAWRNGKLLYACDKTDKMRAHGIKPISCLQEELADIIIRALDFAARFQIDIETAVERKSAYNETREHLHGGKKS